MLFSHTLISCCFSTLKGNSWAALSSKEKVEFWFCCSMWTDFYLTITNDVQYTFCTHATHIQYIVIYCVLVHVMDFIVLIFICVLC